MIGPSTTKIASLLIGTLVFFASAEGCTSKEESDTISLIQNALSDLSQTRAMSEQFVRDVKSNVSPVDPNYERIQESYDNARDANNHFLDTIEGAEKTDNSRSLRTSDAMINARNATADFLADATSALRPSAQTRHIPFAQAVEIPDDIPRSLRKLRKSDRAVLIDRIDRQVRWRSWSNL